MFLSEIGSLGSQPQSKSECVVDALLPSVLLRRYALGWVKASKFKHTLISRLFLPKRQLWSSYTTHSQKWAFETKQGSSEEERSTVSFTQKDLDSIYSVCTSVLVASHQGRWQCPPNSRFRFWWPETRPVWATIFLWCILFLVLLNVKPLTVEEKYSFLIW